ncbi:efflux RND transporter periplasmic adaptor subunit [Shewanella sp. NIFS-20-20]|uniref:efflux RND transporter periplasmic adaptor subunit n=1 Tax=Shewanella sp. NIFS-20-20 TaxID=2853806 RepID=UPI001C492D35|nr:efflux RND transporter periplasmic adaptor subunit [Shewanella sp. NIFS-20-20]MBV7317161.1 efflux RND transporter periplasmic adaptor subunit [Shewanella sp. NIFS-20-20]
MKKWFSIMFIIAVIAFGSVIAFNLFVEHKTAEAIANIPEAKFPVTATKLTPKGWQPTIDAIGFVEPNQGVTLANEVSGIVTSIDFDNGSNVDKGALLIGLDSAVQIANLKTSEVQLPALQADYERLNRLYKQKSVSRQDLDNAQSKYLSMQADIDSLKATIAQRQITAPFSGLVGIRNVNLGQYLQVGTDIVRLEDISSMKIRFTIPQTQISKINVGQSIHVFVDAYPEQPFIGTISAIEPAVFYQSGLIQVQANIPNEDSLLRSGMFAQVAIILPELKDQFVLPQTAINFALYGNSVYVINTTEEQGKPVNRVEQVNVDVIERQGSQALVSGKLQAGQQIVTSGLVRLSNKSKVSIVADEINTPTALPQL